MSGAGILRKSLIEPAFRKNVVSLGKIMMGWLLESKNSRFKFQPFLPNAAAAAKSPQLCPTLCNPIEGSPLGSSVPGILQARTLEWVANSFSNA